ncbi:hypothetical protein XENOCAPTIV_021763 [Xenoophorus captivus]|uniref:Transforming growth factor beta-2 proprotein n=1 Tax=Xenoophorus captivus TaxID=1517983 RepID=A0ABV0QNS4_9TELE
MRLPFLLLLLLRLSEGFNTCQSIDLDAQKSRRIEAVRGQILSKLRIRSPPEDDDDDDPPPGSVPPEVLLLYNSTRELMKERARLAESACERESSEEDYYAKEVQRIDMQPLRTDSNAVQPAEPNLYYRVVYFDVREVDLINSTLVKAEFRIFRAPNPQARASEQRVELYQILKPEEDSTSTQRYIDSRTVQLRGKGAWLSVDVTETIKDWVSDPENNLGLKLGVHCPCCTFVPSTNNIVLNKSEELEALFAGVDDERLRQMRKPGQVKGQADFSTKTPHLILTLLPSDRVDNPAKKNRKRRAAATETTTCSRGSDQGCCLRSLYIDFRRDLNWKWIHEPKGYKANFCAGNCPYLWSANNHYNMVRFERFPDTDPTTHGTPDLNAPLISSPLPLFLCVLLEVLGFVVGGEKEKREALKMRRGTIGPHLERLSIWKVAFCSRGKFVTIQAWPMRPIITLPFFLIMHSLSYCKRTPLFS